MLDASVATERLTGTRQLSCLPQLFATLPGHAYRMLALLLGNQCHPQSTPLPDLAAVLKAALYPPDPVTLHHPRARLLPSEYVMFYNKVVLVLPPWM